MNKVRKAKIKGMTREQLVEELDHAWKRGDHFERKSKAKVKKR
jgi:hypothetical protein